MRTLLLSLAFALLLCSGIRAQEPIDYIPVGEGWAKSSVNAVIFRQASVLSNQNWQYTAYYNPRGQMVLAKRRHGSDHWQKKITRYSGNVKDAHNAISLGLDGKGILHVAWNHHDDELNYVQSTEPGSR